MTGAEMTKPLRRPVSAAEEKFKKTGISPRARKAKGRRLQQVVRDAILVLNDEFRVDDVKSTPMGVNGADVTFSPFVQDRMPIQIECKNLQRHSIYGPFEQAKTHGSHAPVLILKADQKKPLAIVEMDHYFHLWKTIFDLRKGNT